MASDQSANLALPYLAAAQAQKHVTHNEAIRRLDAYVQLALESVTAPAPPATPEQGARWFVPAGATGAFAGQAGRLAAYEAGAFDFLPLPEDALAYIRDEGRLARRAGGSWVALSEGEAAGGPRVLESITATAPPPSPADGACWFVPAGAAGAFSGHALSIAVAAGGAFRFEPVAAGALAFIRDEWRLALYDGGAWVSPLAARPTRSAIEAAVLEEDLVLSGPAADTAVAIPARAIVLAVSTRTLSEVTGAGSYDCGVAGEAAKFGGLLGIARGASNSGVIGPTAFYAPTPVRLTANGGVFTGGRVRVSIHVLTCPPSAFPDLEPAWWAGGAYRLGDAPPALAADFVRERYGVRGGQASSTDIARRSGAAKDVVSASGARVQAPADALAFDYESGHRRMVLEGAATNLFLQSNTHGGAAQAIAVTAQAYTLSFEGGTVVLSGAHSASISGGSGGRKSYTFTPSAGSLVIDPTGAAARVQLETGSVATSYIATTTAAATRVADMCQWSPAAAALLSAAGPNTLALRGTISVASGSKAIASVSGGLLLNITASGVVALYGGPTLLSSGGAIPFGAAADIGVCAGWDAAGRIVARNGAAPVSDGTAPAYDMGGVFFGAASGMPAGARYEIDELLVWQAKGSAANIQAQARGWA